MPRRDPGSQTRVEGGLRQAGGVRRIRIEVAYDGTEFHGWQAQPGLATVQGTIETAVSAIEGAAVRVEGSGRTDAGVHALRQVAAFTLENPIPVMNLRRALNRLLPADIRVLRAGEAAPDFHPRFDALDKTYEYRIFRGEVCPPFERRYVLHHPYPLDAAAMADLAAMFEGEHDFTAFAASDANDGAGASKVRRLYSSVLESVEERMVYRVRGSGFLKHMVRNMVGVLLEVGKGNLSRQDIEARLRPGCGIAAGPAAAARGLFLVHVRYAGDAG